MNPPRVDGFECQKVLKRNPLHSRAPEIRLRVYGIGEGVAVGALPFVMLAIFRTGEQWPGWVALAVSIILGAAAFRTPLAWGAGVAIGVVLSAVTLAILVGTDWRLLPYVLVGFCGYYLSAVSAVVVAQWIGTARRTRRRA